MIIKRKKVLKDFSYFNISLQPTGLPNDKDYFPKAAKIFVEVEIKYFKYTLKSQI